jgi:hypothetical protein
MMNTQNTVFSKTLSGFFLLAFLVATMLLVSCSDDPEPVNEEEVITTVTITLTREGGMPMVLAWDDVNLNGVVDSNEITQDVTLTTNTSYTAAVTLTNKSVTPAENITEEIEEEAEDHLFCFTSTVDLTLNASDEDANGLPIGLTSTWVTGDNTGEGTVRIILRHQPGTKTGACEGGDTDIDLTFPIEIVAQPV